MAVQYTVGQRQYLIDVVITAVAADDAAASAVDDHRAFAFLECQLLQVGVALGRGAAIVPTDLRAFVDPEDEDARHAAGALDLGAQRSEERRVGKECVSTGRSRW